MNKIFKSLLRNPFLIIIYIVFCHTFVSLCNFGNIKKSMIVLLLCISLFIIITIFTIIRVRKNKESKLYKLLYLKQWKTISLIIVIVITLFSGIEVYKSSKDFGSRLSSLIRKVESQRTVKFEHNNIYENGIEFPMENFEDEIVGYTVSLYIPGNEEIMPARYNLIEDMIGNYIDDEEI